MEALHNTDLLLCFDCYELSIEAINRALLPTIARRFYNYRDNVNASAVDSTVTDAQLEALTARLDTLRAQLPCPH
jgi:hypothetical protein